MRIVIVILALLVAAFVGAAVYFRFAPMPPEVWHVDPAEAEMPASPNAERRVGDDAPRIPGTLPEVAVRLAAVAGADGARLIAGDLSEGFATYVARSRIMGYPDAISVRLHDEGDVTRVDVFSRARFGYSDMGVNAARVARWIDAATP